MDISSTVPTATGLLPFVFLVSVALLRQAQGADTPRAVVDAFVAWAMTSYVSAEFLGLFRAIALLPILTVWILSVGFLLAQLWKVRRRLREHCVNHIHDVNETPFFAFFIIASFAATTLFIALTAEPNNWDSQTYHLPRIEHWIQNGSLEHYPTAIMRQNAYPPLAEILILHTRILSGCHVFSSLIQWVSMLCSIFAVFRIAQQLGGGETSHWLAAVFIATLPMGILQSTSTQNDFVTAALLCCFVTLGLQMVSQPAQRLTTAIQAATAGALSGMVKPTGYLTGAGFAVWFFVLLARRNSFGSLLKWGAAAAVIFVVVVGPLAARNLSTYGSIQSDISAWTTNGSFGVRQTVDNLILNTVSNLATGNSNIDAFTTQVTLEITSILGLDVHRADTVIPNEKFQINSYVTHEDYGPNPIHTMLIFVAIGLTVMRWRRLGTPTLLLYWCAWFAGALLFAAMLRWQPWGIRLQLSGFVLAAPIVAVVWPWQLRTVQTITLLTILVCAGLPALLLNAHRQLVPLPDHRSYLSEGMLQRLFTSRPNLSGAYTDASEVLARANASQIGLVMDGDDWEYPIWRILRDRRPDRPIRIEHVQVLHAAGQPARFWPADSWPRGPFVPDALIWTRADPPPRIQVGGREFDRLGRPGPIAVYTTNH